MLNLLKNRTFILALAFAGGLVFSDAAARAGKKIKPVPRAERISGAGTERSG